MVTDHKKQLSQKPITTTFQAQRRVMKMKGEIFFLFFL